MKTRSDEIPEVTQKFKTGCGNIYVTVTWNQDLQPVEVFVAMGKAGECTTTMNETVGRLVSIGLREGLNPEILIRQLKGVRCPKPSGLGKKAILSCPDAVGKGLERAINLLEDPPAKVLELTRRYFHGWKEKEIQEESGKDQESKAGNRDQDNLDLEVSGEVQTKEIQKDSIP